MPTTRGRTQIVEGLSRGVSSLGLLGYAGVLMLMLTVVADTVLRYAFNSPIQGTIEYVSYWYMIPIGFFGMVLAERDNEHIEAPIVFDRLPVAIQREFTAITKVLFVIFLLGVAWWGFDEAMKQYAVRERGGAAGVTIWPTRFFVPLGAVALAIEVVLGPFKKGD